MKWPTVPLLLVLYCTLGSHGGFIPAAIAAGVAAPGALMLLDSLSQRLRDREPTQTAKSPRNTYSSYREENRYNEENVFNERNTYNEEMRNNKHNKYNKFNRFDRNYEDDDNNWYGRENRYHRDDRHARDHKGDRYGRDHGDNLENRYGEGGRPEQESGYRGRNRFGDNHNHGLPYRTGNADAGRVFNTYNINNNNINNYASALEMPEMAQNVVTNLKYATKDIQPPNVVVPKLKSSRSGQTSVTVNGKPFTKGSNYVIVGSRAIAIQQIEIVVPDSFTFPSDHINIDIIVYDGDLYEHPIRQNVRTTFNGDDLGQDIAVVLENSAIPPASVRIAVNDGIVGGDVILNAVTFPSNTDGASPLPQTGLGVFMLNGQPISPYTFSVGADKSTAPVRNVKVTDPRGKMLSGLIDIEVSPYNRNEPHPVLLINGRPVDSSEVLKVNGELVTAEDLVFYVNGRPSSVVADFAISMDLMEELSEVAQNSAVISSWNDDFLSRDTSLQTNGNTPGSPHDVESLAGDRFSKPSRAINPGGSPSSYRSKPTRRPLDQLRSTRRLSRAMRRKKRARE